MNKRHRQQSLNYNQQLYFQQQLAQQQSLLNTQYYMPHVSSGLPMLPENYDAHVQSINFQAPLPTDPNAQSYYQNNEFMNQYNYQNFDQTQFYANDVHHQVGNINTDTGNNTGNF